MGNFPKIAAASDARGITPAASSELVRMRMSKQRRRDTKPELQVRKALYSRGIRYRVDVRPEPDLRSRADIAWKRLRLAVFIDGCFWHSCPKHRTSPKTNKDWWEEKLRNNIIRDRRCDADLAARGWTVLRFWEHEDPVRIADSICTQIRILQ